MGDTHIIGHSRRHFMLRAGAFGLGFAGLGRAMGRTLEMGRLPLDSAPGFGALVKDPAGVLDLPAGFSYSILSRAGEAMSDGLVLPGRPDAMAAFPGRDGLTILMRNHEMERRLRPGPFGKDQELLARVGGDRLYDAGTGDVPSLGGVTTLVYDTREKRVLKQFLSLAGTERNCAGGMTPWGTWISCEETVDRAGNGHAKDHGFNFEVPAGEEMAIVDPVPLVEMGRFVHEACAVDPASGVVYQTEDVGDGLLYRYVPNVRERLGEGGRLQALVVKGRASLDTRNWGEVTMTPRVRYEVEWVDLEDVLSPDDSLRHQGYGKGAARFARGEGMWWANGAAYFACTNGGRARVGQIFKLIPSPFEGTAGEREEPGTLELFVESPGKGVMENADNICASPWGDLIVCEDGSGEQFLHGITPKGEIYRFGRNAVSGSEFAGAAFSPDGTTLFVNIQNDGLTLAITGPWAG